MVANLLSFMISRRFQPVPVYHALLHQDGIHLPSASTRPSRSARTARHVMTTDEKAVIPPDLTVAAAWQWAQAHGHPVYLVGTPERLVGAVQRSELDDLHATDKADASVVTITQESFVHAHPDHAMDIVLERLEESGGLLPVVSRTDARHLEGFITAESLTRRRLQRPEQAPPH
jgi:hypothetical protein